MYKDMQGSPPLHRHTRSCHQNKKHFHGIVWSPAFWARHRALFNSTHQVRFQPQFWACVVQRNCSIFWVLLKDDHTYPDPATLCPKEILKPYTITFPAMIPPALETGENGYFHWRIVWFTVLKSLCK